ncbi:hypothetical protein [Polymorphobacter multimanifer]|uniref:Uncharacterized protein n=1 Tax=Polymorphobacter multimanifer TaxID=1070431 RepID=A0A841L2S8_9SPHN|nr:hypothetical protein [Polymorphobacter multimanifer]MBB6226967.1 hypothetical protein [Polymorphobacter multimanifer]
MTKPREPQTESNEQQGEDQAQDVAQDRLEGLPGDDHDMLASRKAKSGLDDDNDYIDTVDHLKGMVTSGRVDMSAYAGEPMMDDGDTVVSDALVADGGEGDDDLGADPDDRGALNEVADTGENPLAAVASDHGDVDETSDDDAGSDEVDSR